MDNPEDYHEPAQWIMDALASRQKKLTDTVLFHGEEEVAVRIYYPDKKSLRNQQAATLFIHGGGFMYGSVEEYHIMVSKLAKTTGQIFVSIEYRLAPEYPFPDGLDDCYRVFCWLREKGNQIGADTSRISLMGDSAGGNLATVITLRCRDELMPQALCQVLLYPAVTFVDTEYPSRRYFAQTGEKSFVLTEEFMRSVKQSYLANVKDELNPYISPLESELTPDLPPALIITAECDPLRDGARQYAEKLDACGVSVEYLEYSGMIHGFMSFHMILREATDAMKYIRDYLDRI